MKFHGHPVTWETRCFISSSCNKTVYAHTNGYGDFVLFDSLGWPWPIHRCYTDRAGVHVGRFQEKDLSDIPDPDWTEVVLVMPDPDGPRNRYGFIGTVTNIEKGFVSKSEEFRGQDRASSEETKKVLRGRTSLITVTTDGGCEFTAFADLKKSTVRFRDTVACDVKAVHLLNKAIFIVTKMRDFQYANNENEK